MGQVDLFKRMFNVILNYIYTLAFCIIVIVTEVFIYLKWLCIYIFVLHVTEDRNC